MTIAGWELAHSPLEQDPLRYKVRINATEEGLRQLVNKIPASCGRPFATLAKDFNWAFYVYSCAGHSRSETIEVLRGLSPNGQVAGAIPPSEGDDPPAAVFGGQMRSRAAFSPADDQGAFRSAIEQVPLDLGHTFSEFVVDPGSRFAHAAAKVIAETRGIVYNPFFICGGIGSGKTHLMQAISHAVISRNPRIKILHVRGEAMAGRIAEAIQAGAVPSLRDWILGFDFLLVDDIQFFLEDKPVQEELARIFKDMETMGKQTVISSDRSLKAPGQFSEKLKARIECGLTVFLKGPDRDTRSSILKKKSNSLSLLSGAAVAAMAERAGLEADMALPALPAAPDAAQADPMAPTEHERVVPVPLDVIRERPTEHERVVPVLLEVTREQPAEPEPARPPEPEAMENQTQAQTAETQEPIARPDDQPPQKQNEEMAVISAEASVEITPKVQAAPENSLKDLNIGFFYPESGENQLDIAFKNLRDVIAKYKLKIQVSMLFKKSYECQERFDGSPLIKECRSGGCSIAFVLGVPAASLSNPDDFSRQLADLFEGEKIALQQLAWADLNKTGRYLQCALELSLLNP